MYKICMQHKAINALYVRKIFNIYYDIKMWCAFFKVIKNISQNEFSNIISRYQLVGWIIKHYFNFFCLKTITFDESSDRVTKWNLLDVFLNHKSYG